MPKRYTKDFYTSIHGLKSPQGSKKLYAKALLEKRKSNQEKKGNTEWQQ
jgi:hypothetical protein